MPSMDIYFLSFLRRSNKTCIYINIIQHKKYPYIKTGEKVKFIFDISDRSSYNNSC